MALGSIPLKLTNLLRVVRREAIHLQNRTLMALRHMRTRNSDKPVVIVLSLGSLGRSLEVARQANLKGLKVHVFCHQFPSPEARFADGWTRLDCRTDFDKALDAAQKLNPVAILVESKNLLLPMQSHLSNELGIISVGEKAAETSNSKIALRQYLDDASVPNLPWCRLENLDFGCVPFPLVIKPDLGTASKGVRYIGTKEELANDDEYRDEIEKDESVGEAMLAEAYIEGRQFDVEGVALNGEYFPLAIVEEFYEAAPPYFPPVWFHFNPPIDSTLQDKLLEATFAALKALGVKNGAWHIEQRVDGDGIVRILDYANRMGYNLLISEAAGTSFAGNYVSLMTNSDFEAPKLAPSTMLQLFAFDTETLNKMKQLVRQNPEVIQSKSFFQYEFSYHLYLGYVVIKTDNYASLKSVLDKFGLTPTQFENWYA